MSIVVRERNCAVGVLCAVTRAGWENGEHQWMKNKDLNATYKTKTVHHSFNDSCCERRAAQLIHIAWDGDMALDWWVVINNHVWPTLRNQRCEY